MAPLNKKEKNPNLHGPSFVVDNKIYNREYYIQCNVFTEPTTTTEGWLETSVIPDVTTTTTTPILVSDKPMSEDFRKEEQLISILANSTDEVATFYPVNIFGFLQTFDRKRLAKVKK